VRLRMLGRSRRVDDGVARGRRAGLRSLASRTRDITLICGVDAGRLRWVVDFEALEAAGIANARERAGLIDYLDKLGFTAEEMVEAERRGRLFGLAGDVLQWSGPPVYNLDTAAQALGVPV